MKNLDQANFKNVQVVFTDIDDTLTIDGFLPPQPYEALWRLSEAGIRIVPVTGRPAGWCELIARQWPVDGVIGENGGFYFRLKNKEMKRIFAQPESTRTNNQSKLLAIRDEVLTDVPGTALASDQFCRLIDLAIDFCEDVDPLPKSDVQRIVAIYKKHGAQAKISSIHVNGWFGEHNKLSMCQRFVKEQYGWDGTQLLAHSVFIGDSPNDEPMFAFFDRSVAVANIEDFAGELLQPPKFKTPSKGGLGFTEFADAILKSQ